MEEIIAPVPKELLRAELTEDKRLRFTHRSDNEIYIVTAFDSPNVMREIGRLREIAFRAAGGGTGKALDLDDFDTCEHPYYQLIVWDPEEEMILGGYRFLPGTEIQLLPDGQPNLATSHMFRFSDDFIKNHLHETVELGRSFVTLEYQSSGKIAKGLFALDNLWDGLGALTIVIPTVKYFFGKMTMYPSFHRRSRDLILYFLDKHFPDKDRWVRPIHPVMLDNPIVELEKILYEVDLKADYKLLNMEVRKYGVNIPPLINAYMGLSPTMRVFGTAVNHDFGNVEETGILIAFEEILEQKRIRHIESFAQNHPEAVDFFKDYFLAKNKTN
jgi:hypothetical protein